MIEKALRYELEQAIPELIGNIYPTNAPESSKRPYLVYARITTRHVKTLDGYTGKHALGFMFNVMASKYADMKALAEKVEAFLIALPRTNIGENNLQIEDLEINNISEAYEFELKVNRGIIDFTIYF